LRRFHAAAAVTMVATPSLMSELSGRGFSNLGMWTRGVDVDLFRPDRAIDLDFPRPIFMTVGRVAVEKNLPAFLSLDLPGTKVVIGAGPQQAELKRRFPAAKFLGQLDNGILAAHLAAADVFVFPSLTDTFGIVQLEALASGVPVAAFPVTGPRDVIGNHSVGILDADLRTACMRALWISREACREFALRYSWENSARQFVSHARKVAVAAAESSAAAPLQAPIHSEPQSLVPDSDRDTTRMTHEHSI
jgi:1,2-diacylglycerol 3-alpha-glucosyltransferase/glucuronosyltransferase